MWLLKVGAGIITCLLVYAFLTCLWLCAFDVPPPKGGEPLFLPASAEVPDKETEWVKWIVKTKPEWKHAQVEYVLWDKSRVDMLTEAEAIEVDWASKWSEAIGQATYYAEITGKKPAVLLLSENLETDRAYLYRGQVACARLHYPLYIIKVGK